MTNDLNNPEEHGSRSEDAAADRTERSGSFLLVAAVVAALIIAAVWWALSKDTKKPAETPAAPTAAAQPAANDPVILTVNGEEIRQSQFDAAAASLPEQMRPAIAGPGGRKALAEEIIRLKLLEQEGRKLKVDEQPDIAARLKLEASNIIARGTLPKLIAERGTKDIRQLYEENKGRFEFVKARQIIISAEGTRLAQATGKSLPRDKALAKAKDIADKLKAGAKWEEMLKLSDDTEGAKQGGSLGEMPRSQTPEEIEPVLFALQPGQTSDPVETPFGIHIFQVTEKGIKSFDELKPALEQQGDKLRADAIIEKLRTSANVNFDQKFFGPNVK